MTEGKQASAWLAKVTKDQNLEKLALLNDIPFDTLRRFFLSGIIQPTLNLDHVRVTTTTTALAVSIATGALTVPEGHVYKLIAVMAANDTRAPTWQVTYTPNGGAGVIILESSQTVSQATHFPLMGGGATVSHNAVGGGIIGPLWMRAGDVMSVYCSNFVAADVMTHAFIYEDYVVGV